MLLSNTYKELEHKQDLEFEIENKEEDNVSSITIPNEPIISFHPTIHKWTLWAHLPHDTDWSLKSYKKIYDINSIEEMITITETIPDILIKNCMLFIMRYGVNPLWEDPMNKSGGCFSYKVSNKNVYEVWRDLTYVLIGNVISSNEQFICSVTGITISPKKNFCIIKIWMTNCKNQNATVVTNDVKGLTSQGCIFKKHAPEY